MQSAKAESDWTLSTRHAKLGPWILFIATWQKAPEWNLKAIEFLFPS